MRLPEDVRKGGMRPAVKGPPSGPGLYPDANVAFADFCAMTWRRPNIPRDLQNYPNTVRCTYVVEVRKGNEETRPFGAALVTTRSLNRNDAWNPRRRIMPKAMICYKSPRSWLSE